MVFWTGPLFAFDIEACTQLIRPLLSSERPIGYVIKRRPDSSIIYRYTEPSGRLMYYKESPLEMNDHARVFDRLQTTMLVSNFAESLGLSKYVAKAEASGGVTLIIDGKVTKTRPGILQNGAGDLITPIDVFTSTGSDRRPTIYDIQKVLNTGDWPRLYANWKIFWTIFMQIDLNIANLARKGSDNFIFDTADAFHLPEVRLWMGIPDMNANLNISPPNSPSIRIHHRADFRLADPEFKNMAKILATESVEETAKRFGMSLTDELPGPRGLILTHVRAIKSQAKWIVRALDLSPFDY